MSGQRGRLGFTALLVGGLVAVAAWAAPVLGQPAPTPTPSPSASDNTAEICAASAKTLETGLEKFVAQMQSVSQTATSGDLVKAEQGVKDAGTQLVQLANDLRTDAQKATNPEVRTTLEDLADEFETQGKGLNGLSALQNFDIKRIEAVATRMTAICGGPSPSPLPTVIPSPTN